MHRIRQDQSGLAHVIVFVLLMVIAVLGYVGWLVFNKQKVNNVSTNNKESQSIDSVKLEQPDSKDTLSSPQEIKSSDGKTYFYYGAPAGQNNKSKKRVVISLPGHGTTAKDGYDAWKEHIIGGQYALAEFNWWDGTGETKEDYYSPPEIIKQVKSFLDSQSYSSGDIVILHGFSRGSANSYAVVASDRLGSQPVFDAVISNAGKYQTDFPLAAEQMNDAEITKLFKGIPWVLVCGGKDPNPTRDGCLGMEETKLFLLEHEANVLGILTDPAMGHGAFHQSSLGLPKQAFELIEKALE